MKDIQSFYPGQDLYNRHCILRLLKTPATIRFLKEESENLYLFSRDGIKPGPDELGPAALGTEGLLCPLPHETDEVQEGQLAQLPGLQAWETWLGLLRTPGVSVYSKVKAEKGWI